MHITCNGESLLVADESRLADLIHHYAPQSQSVAAAVNHTVVPASQWPDCALCEGDKVDIFTLVAGG